METTVTDIHILDSLIPRMFRSLFQMSHERMEETDCTKKQIHFNTTIIRCDKNNTDMLYYIRPRGEDGYRVNVTITLQVEQPNFPKTLPRLFPEEFSSYLRNHIPFMKDACLDFLIALMSRFVDANVYQSYIEADETTFRIIHDDVVLTIESKND